MKDLYIIKIGGNIIDHVEKLESFLEDFAQLEGFKILVHGGGKIATKLSEDLGIEAKLVEGRRITDAESLKIVTMVYAGLINKNIVASLQAVGGNAIGLTGADGNMIQASKRPIKISASGDGIDYGFVGDLDKDAVNAKAIEHLLLAGFIPVFSAITHDRNGQLLNTNADTIASAIAVAMAKIYKCSLVYCFEKTGVLRDVEDEASLITEIDATYYGELKSAKVIFEGMIPKLDNAFQALESGVSEVFIGNADALPALSTKSFGTRIILKK